ncbi:hypoxanthine phosphoribosyltransferase [Geobacter sp. DSM 9736]|uniref:hypoxanthine phosphoribosyltransferase n=1 Tax=Geobacter sp. DSM 9736 TaxID=1277350 RepID=UPI000B61E8B0|nr:hypoxanthine phosphoribosyltransferase [Geobacter sp. DSM 9736]SNB46019.1 hypoxanthine phosphoribosyltransferase [Geobacter sp. DSM 9736]
MKPIYDEKNGMQLQLLYSRQRIADAVDRLAAEVSADYAGRELLVIVVLQGAFMFAADLVRKLTVPLNLDFVRIASYQGTESTGKPVTTMQLKSYARGRHLLVVEDIVDTGISLSALLRDLQEEGPASLRVCTLIDKHERRRADVRVDYAGIVCESGFVVGYGLDLNGDWRQLPDIYHAEPVSAGRD